MSTKDFTLRDLPQKVGFGEIESEVLSVHFKNNLYYFVSAGFDVDRDTLGIGIVQAGSSEIGQWQYSDDGNVWQNILIATNISRKGTIDGDEAEILFLTPGQKIRFQPSQSDNVWGKRDAFKTILRFVLWDQTDGLPSGLHRVAVKG
jgi:hypothetical protein